MTPTRIPRLRNLKRSLKQRSEMTAAGSWGTVQFIKLGVLIDEIKEATEEYDRQRLSNKLFNTDLLILDEMDFYPTDEVSSTFLFRLIQQRCEKGLSIIFTSQKSFEGWGDIFGSNSRTSAILGRINHHGNIINIDGPSYRLKDKLVNKFTDEQKLSLLDV